jgi:hypothetical protein
MNLEPGLTASPQVTNENRLDREPEWKKDEETWKHWCRELFTSHHDNENLKS